jgi:hypothetical protein
MFMSFKFQIIYCNSPYQLFNCCLNCFSGIEETIDSAESLSLLESFKEKFIERYSVISAFEYLIIK